ncbi:MAG: M23 family metallopeptidase [Pseudomonadota bacterium]
MSRPMAAAALLAVLAWPGLAGDLALDGPFVQGGLVIGRAAPDAQVEFEGRKLRVSADGVFLIGFGRDASPQARLDIAWPDGQRERRTLEVAPRAYPVERIDGLPERQVTPAPEDLARIAEEAALIAAARARDSPGPDFGFGFVWPVAGTVTGVYGSQRILNGVPRQPHFGVDIAAPAGTPVMAAAAGEVVLVHEDMFFTGKTVVLDHGHGLSSAYSHLSAVGVRAGQRLARGEPLGRVGATGRVTGAHLDWRVNLFDIRLDPALLVPPMPVGGPAGGG